MTQHTPGPWTVDRTYGLILADKGKTEVAACHAGRGGDSEANARLIAAAPEMLEALKEVAATTDDADWLTRFQSIIAKAEGRPCST